MEVWDFKIRSLFFILLENNICLKIGVYGDAEKEHESVNLGFEQIERIFHKVQDLMKSGKINLKWTITLEGDDCGGRTHQWRVKGAASEDAVAEGFGLQTLIDQLDKMLSEPG